MKLGIIMPVETGSFQKAKDFGLDFLEFDLNPQGFWGPPLEELEAAKESIKQASQETGVAIGAVGRWASQIFDKQGNVDEKEWQDVRHVIDLGAYWGAKYFLCSVNYVKALSYYQNITISIAILRKIVAYAKERGMETGIVNCMMGDNYIRTPEQWKLVLDEVSGLGIKYDPSHSFVHGGEKGAYLHEGLEWGAHFTYCHIKGVIQGGESNEAKHWMLRALAAKHPEIAEEIQEMHKDDDLWYDNPPAGIDAINWRAFFAILYKYDYSGYLSIEPHSATWQGDKGMKGIAYTIKYIRDLMI